MTAHNTFIEFGPSQLINVKQVAVFMEPSSPSQRLLPLLAVVSADGYTFNTAYTENYVKNFGDLVERLEFVLGSQALLVLQDPRMIIVKEHVLHMYSAVSTEGSRCRVQLQSGLDYAVHGNVTYNRLRDLLQGVA